MAGVAITSFQTTVQNGTVASFVVALPPFIQPGDLILVCASKNQTTGFSWPSGWTLPGAPTGASGGTRSEARYRVAQAGDPPTITITSAGAGRWSGVAFRITRAGTIDGLADGSPSAVPPDPPLLATPGGLFIAYAGTLTQTAPSGPPAGYLDFGTIAATGGPTSMWGRKTVAASSENPGPFQGVSDANRSITFSIVDLGPLVFGVTQAQVGTDTSAATPGLDTSSVSVPDDGTLVS